MNRITTIFAALSLVLAASSTWAQQTGYISDIFRVPVRSGAGNQFRILHAGLPSGTRFEVLATEGDWTQIETDGGLEGWIPSQYVVTQPTARIQLAQVEQRLARTQEQNATLTARVAELEQENRSLQNQLDQLEQTAEQATEELSEIRTLSADTINLNQRHQELLEQHQVLQTTVDTLRAENDRLASDNTINQWLYGAGLVLFGIFLSIVLPALKPKKRFSDWA